MCGKGGMHSEGGACVVKGACIAGRVRGGGHVWQGEGACVAGGGGEGGLSCVASQCNINT